MMLQALASAEQAFDPSSGWVGSVVTPVIVVALFLAGVLHTSREVKRLEDDLAGTRKELAEERAKRDQLQEVVTERVVPALVRSTDVLEAITPLLQTQTRLRGSDS